MPTPQQCIHLSKRDYRLVQQIGTSSGYGEVWLATALDSPGEQVALKFVSGQLTQSASADDRIRLLRIAIAERAFLEQVPPWDNRHIVRLVDSGEYEGFPVLGLELMHTDMSQVLASTRKKGRPVPAERTLAWLRQVNHALARVHDRGWRHLDLKPANLLLDSTHAHLRLADFGSSRQSASDPEHSFVGTIGWQAPEQIRSTRDGAAVAHYSTDSRSDYFALGVLFFTAVTTGEVLRFSARCKQEMNALEPVAASERAVQANGRLWAIDPDEEQLFLRCFAAAQRSQATTDATWCAGSRLESPPSPSAALQALALLRSLLSWSPDERPAHEGVIARALMEISCSLQGEQENVRSGRTASAGQRVMAIASTRARPDVEPRTASASLRLVAPWVITAAMAISVVSLGLIPAIASAGETDQSHVQVDLPLCADLVSRNGVEDVRLSIVQPAAKPTLDHAVSIARRSENLQLCSAAWTDVLPLFTPWAKVPSLEKWHGWLMWGVGLLLSLVACAWLTPRSWWRGGPGLVGWVALAVGTTAFSSVLLGAFAISPWARGLLFTQPVAIEVGSQTPKWTLVAGAHELDRLLRDIPLKEQSTAVAGHKSDSKPRSKTVGRECCRADRSESTFAVHQALNLRSGPGVQHERLKVLEKGSVVHVTGLRSGDWWEVTMQTAGEPRTGWVSSLWLRQPAPSLHTH